MTKPVLTRRAFVTGGLALCGLSTAPLRAAAILGQTPRFTSTPFTLGVASGDPSPDGFVLWTRLAIDPLNGGGMPPVPVEVNWEVAADDRFANIIRRGRTSALPEWAHSVHIELDGLEPSRWYWYRFRSGDAVSPAGRTRTLPRTGAPADRLRFAFVSCQNYQQGHFMALQHLANEDLGMVFHLGDYIYEGAGNPNAVRQHIGPEIESLDHYRNRHAQYKTDPDLQAAHAAFPFVVTWDDHEVDNNYSAAISEGRDPVEAFERRRTAAYRAYYEHMPLRTSSVPRGAWLQLYRGFSYGSLASFFVLDTRQFRTDQPCEDGTKVPCREVYDEQATLLGPGQEQWLFEGFSRSRAKWNVLPQQVMMAPVDRAVGDERRLSMDQWSGYDAERLRLLRLFSARRLANPVVLTGDIHSNWVNDLRLDALDARSPVVATEFVGTSLTSGGDGADAPENLTTLLSENPFVKFHNMQRGYVTCDVTEKTMRADYHVLDYVTRPGSPKRVRASFIVEDGRPGASRI